MTEKNSQEGPKKAICAVNMHTRLIYTHKTRVNVSYATFERADKVRVKWSPMGLNGLNPRHMMRSDFVCIRCFKTTLKKTGNGYCLACYDEINSYDHNIYYDGDDDDIPYEYDYFQEPCPICGNYEICDGDYHREYELSFSGLSSQVRAIECYMCGGHLRYIYHVMPDDLFANKYAVARCDTCQESYFIFHDVNYQITTIMRPYPPSVDGKYRSNPVVIDNNDEIPF